MDLERLMIEWNEQQFEGYLFETPSHQIAADVRKRSEARRRLYRLRNYAGVILLVVMAAATAIGFFEVHGVSTRIALLIVMPAVSCELLFLLKWRAREYRKPLHVSGKTFLLDEHGGVLRQIRQTKWQLAWYALTIVAGFIYLFWPTTQEPDDWALSFLSGALLGLIIVHVLALVDRILELRPALIRIQHDLKKYDAVVD